MPFVASILYYSLAVVLALAAIEAVVLQWRRGAYDWRAYFASLTDVLVRNYLIYVWLPFGLADPLTGLLWQHRIATVPLDTAAAIAVLFVGQEFCYYWFHRASHRIRWFWATHAVHHSATHFNLSAAVRLGWTGLISGIFIFYLPLALIGFNPAAIALTLAAGLVYQFFLHTALPVHLDPLEWVLNTP